MTDLLEKGFVAGMKIEIRIPGLHAKAFCDWAVVDSVDNDLISIRLSRDVLPDGVSLRIGQVLECRNINDNRGFSHQTIVVSKGFSQELQLRMIGLIAADERREFFRIDLFLPIRCQIARNKSSYSLQKQWKQQQKHRRADENARKKSIMKPIQ